MNAAQTSPFSFLSPVSSASVAAPSSSADAPAFSTSRAPLTPRAPRPSRKKRHKVAPVEEPLDEFRECLHQAEICREQAQEAARLKRFHAALGLFQTAIVLCQRAVGLRSAPRSVVEAAEPFEAPDEDEASKYLQVLTIEMATYADLARSLERPIVEKHEKQAAERTLTQSHS